MVLHVLFLQQVECRLQVSHLMGEPADHYLGSPYLGQKVEVAEGMVHECGRGIPLLSQCKQLADQGLCEHIVGREVKERGLRLMGAPCSPR